MCHDCPIYSISVCFIKTMFHVFHFQIGYDPNLLRPAPFLQNDLTRKCLSIKYKNIEYNQQIDDIILMENQFQQLSGKIKMQGFVKLSKSENRCMVQDINLQRETSMPFQKIWVFGNIKTLKKALWPLFADGVQLPQVQSYFEEAVYILPLNSQKSLVLILSTLIL